MAGPVATLLYMSFFDYNSANEIVTDICAEVISRHVDSSTPVRDDIFSRRRMQRCQQLQSSASENITPMNASSKNGDSAGVSLRLPSSFASIRISDWEYVTLRNQGCQICASSTCEQKKGSLQKKETRHDGSNTEMLSCTSAGSSFSSGLSLLRHRKEYGDVDAAKALDSLERETQKRNLGASRAENLLQTKQQKNISHGSVQDSLRGSLQMQSSESLSSLDVLAQQLGGEVKSDILDLVLSMRMSPEDRVYESDIAGLCSVRKLVRDKIIYPIKRPDLHHGLHQPPKGILLFGPPGTGKTMLAKWVASESGATFFEVTPSALISKFHGETETIIKTLFLTAEYFSPSIIFIDEVDSLLGKRRERDDEAGIRMKNQILQMMDGVRNKNKVMVVVVAATNRPDMLDEAAIRRLSRRVLVPLPDLEAREGQIRSLLLKHNRQHHHREQNNDESGDQSMGQSSSNRLSEKEQSNLLSVGQLGHHHNNQSNPNEPNSESKTNESRLTLNSSIDHRNDNNIDENENIGMSSSELRSIAERLEGWNGSDLKALCAKAADYPYDEAIMKFGGVENIPNASSFRSITYHDFILALEDVHASSLGASIESLQEWERLMGCS